MHSLIFLKHLTIIHCDLKPENILLRHPKRSGIKIIDFGTACYADGKMFTYLQSRFYRSPEIVLQAPFDYAIDMWSAGCILFEMHVGKPLFPAADQSQLLDMMTHSLGPIPRTMLERGEKTSTFYAKNEEDGSFCRKRTGAEDDSEPAINDAIKKTLEERIQGTARRREGEKGHTKQDYNEFCDFIRRMLKYEDRLTAEQALAHPFVQHPASSLPPPPPEKGGRRRKKRRRRRREKRWERHGSGRRRRRKRGGRGGRRNGRRNGQGSVGMGIWHVSKETRR